MRLPSWCLYRPLVSRPGFQTLFQVVDVDTAFTEGTIPHQVLVQGLIGARDDKVVEKDRSIGATERGLKTWIGTDETGKGDLFGPLVIGGFVADTQIAKALKEMGVRRLGKAIERNCEQARWLGGAVEEASCLELLAPVSLNIVCYRFQRPGIDGEQADRLNRRIVVELQCRGIAAPSFTQLQGNAAIRVCITNHRTTQADLQALLDATIELGDELLAGGHHWDAYDIRPPA